MGKKARIIGIGLAVLAVAIIGLRFGLAERASDRQLIQRTVEDSIAAGRKGEPGGVMEILSRRFEVNREAPNRMDIGRFVRQSKPEVKLVNTEPVIQGEQAEIRTPASVRFGFLGNSVEQRFDEVVIRFRKETGVKWLIIPTKEWRIVSVEAPGASASGFLPE